MSAAARRLVYWDIDGTILTTGRAGIPAWEAAAADVLHSQPSLAAFSTAGLTDRMIARQLVQDLGHQPDEAVEHAILASYADRLPDCLRTGGSNGRLLENVAEIVGALSNRDDVVVALLTGNLRAAALAKLAYYGLQPSLFHLGVSGFADDGFERPAIGRVALARARQELGELAPGNGFLVGDTPYDTACAEGLDLRCIAVATGGYDRAALERCRPWRSCAALPSADEFLSWLDLGPAPTLQ